MEKSIRRSELAPPAGSVSSSPEVEAIKNLDHLEFVNKTNENEGEVVELADEDELEFRLFAPQSAQQGHGVQTVKIRSPAPEVGEAGFIQQQRPANHYFTAAIDEKSATACAMTTEDIHRIAAIKWHGTACPWKVLKLPASSQSKAARSQYDTMWSRRLVSSAGSKRNKPGKKLRIKLRIATRAAKATKAEEQLAQEVREAADREKRTRKNREKKIKQRMRSKAKKAGPAAEDDGAAQGDPAG